MCIHYNGGYCRSSNQRASGNALSASLFFVLASSSKGEVSVSPLIMLSQLPKEEVPCIVEESVMPNRENDVPK